MSSSQGTLLQLYLSFVRPIVEYAAPVWDPHYACHIQALEKVQKFALRMSAKLWDHDYNQLLLLFGLPTLESRRKILKLCYLAGTLRGAIHCTHPPREMDSRLRSYSTSTLVLPFTRTRSYQHSFFPHAMKLWNDLPPDTKSCFLVEVLTVLCCAIHVGDTTKLLATRMAARSACAILPTTTVFYFHP